MKTKKLSFSVPVLVAAGCIQTVVCYPQNPPNDQPVNLSDGGSRDTDGLTTLLRLLEVSTLNLTAPTTGDDAYQVKIDSGYAPSCITYGTKKTISLVGKSNWRLFFADKNRGVLAITFDDKHPDVIRIHEMEPIQPASSSSGPARLQFEVSPKKSILTIDGKPVSHPGSSAHAGQGHYGIIHICLDGKCKPGVCGTY